jgi:hypothetical protein
MQPDQVRYPNSKLANTIFSCALASRATASGKQWAVNIFDPGFVPGGGSKLHRSEQGTVTPSTDSQMQAPSYSSL